MARTLETRSILHMCNRQPELFSMSFRNEDCQVYAQAIVAASPDLLQLAVTAPEGRVSDIGPKDSWTATLWNQLGAYQSKVQRLQRNGSLLTLTLHPRTQFLARRKNIRLAPDSRNPTCIHFYCNEKPFQGFVVDFCLEGLGIETQSASALDVGCLLTNGQFSLKGISIGFEKARIVQRAWAHPRIRLGLVYETLSDEQEEWLHAAYHQSLTPGHSASTVLDG